MISSRQVGSAESHTLHMQDIGYRLGHIESKLSSIKNNEEVCNLIKSTQISEKWLDGMIKEHTKNSVIPVVNLLEEILSADQARFNDISNRFRNRSEPFLLKILVIISIVNALSLLVILIV